MFIDILTTLIIAACFVAGVWIIRQSYPNIRLPRLSLFG